MLYPTVDTYFSKRYNKEYDLVYGQKRLNTGYEFNAETTELYSDNIYENLVSAKDTSKYYRNFYSADNKSVPGFLLDNATYKLYNNNDRADSTDLEIYGSKLLDITKTVEWSNIPGNDVTTKLCFYNLDGDTKSLSEIKSALVLYDGYEVLNDVMENSIVYHITDDVSEMSLLNEKPCYLYTNSEYNTAGDRIAIRINVLPKFVRYTSASNNVKYSLDFGLPKEIYEKLDYSENATVYNKFWDNFYKDQFNVNTKKLTCFVKLNDLWVSNELLREFYYFANSYWLLNKIEGFDINSDITTRCEFIKVQEIDNYTQGISQFDEFIQFDPATSVVDHNAGSITINVQSNIPWKVGFYNDLKITNITPQIGTAGITPVTIEYNENTTYNNEFFYARFTPENSNDGPSFDIKQLPNLDNVVTVSGTVKYRSGVKPEWDPTICAISDTFTNCVIVRGNTYKMYVPKNTAFNIEIQGEYSAIIETKSVGALTEDYIID